jgi:hypothetical protein
MKHMHKRDPHTSYNNEHKRYFKFLFTITLR